MSDTQSRLYRTQLLLGTALVCTGVWLTALPAQANPSGGKVVAGQATIRGSGRSVTVTQTSQRSVIDWKSFSIGSGQTTRFNLPSSTAAVLNRVSGDQLSSLLGNLYSNGQVYLLNANGVLVGKNGIVDTKGFVASTLDVSNKAFMAGGAQTFAGNSTAGITILGSVKADGGDVLLVAAQIDNKGSIVAPDGKAILAAGSEVLYVPGEDANIVIAAQAPGSGAAVSNDGLIKAASVQLAAAGSAYALAVNNGGEITATGIKSVGGHVVLDGGNGDVTDSGTVTATAGNVAIDGGRVALTGKAAVDVSGAHGGTVNVVATNAAVVTKHASIAANATGNGNGGSISIKAAKATSFSGTASVAANAGVGGRAEISGGSLSFAGKVDRSAGSGQAGTLLFDPADIRIVSGNAAAPAAISGGLWAFASNPTGTQTISVGAVETLLAGGNLELQASDSLTVAAPSGGSSFQTITTTSTHALTLTAPTITVNGSVSMPNGTLVLKWTDADATAFSTNANTVTSTASAAITAKTVRVAGDYSAVTLNGAVTTASLQFNQPDFFTNITIKNAANAIAAVSLDPGGNNHSTSFDLETSSALTVAGDISNPSPAGLTITAGGDLTLAAGVSIFSPKVVLASTGGVFDNLAGSGAVTAPNGRIVIYSATNGVGTSGTTFDDGGLSAGATIFQSFGGVHYPSDPDTANTLVEYFGALSAQPTLTITANSFARTYGQADPTFTARYSGGTAAALTIDPSFRIVQGSDVNAGIYTIEPYGAASNNHLIRYVDGTLTVNPAVLTITAHDATMTYGNAEPSFTASYSGFVNGDTSAIVSGLTISAGLLTSNPSAGDYILTPAGASVAIRPGELQPNYTIVYQTGTLTVDPRPLTVTASPYSVVYGADTGSAHLAFSGFATSGPAAGDASTVPGQYVPVVSAVPGSDVGTYAITLQSLNPNPNYATTYVGANLTITPAPLTITPNLNRIYGAGYPATLPAADFTGLVAGDTPASLTGQPTLSSTGVNVGSYRITASGAVDPNYTISYAPGTLTITPAALTITANGASRTYGSANPAFTASYNGLANGDTGAVLSGLTFSTAATSASNVGTYTITPSGATDANYTISYAPGTLTVTRAALTITPTGSMTYGQNPATDAAITYNATGLVNGDTIASLATQPTFATPATSTTHAGFYALFASGAADPNYTISYVPGTLAVNRAVLTLSINASSVYGAAINTPVTATGLVNGDTLTTVFGAAPTGSTAATSTSNVGTYAASILVGPTLDPDYAVKLGPATYKITPAPLIITANNMSAVYGSVVPTFGASYSGFVNGDTSTVVTGLTFGTNALEIGVGKLTLASSVGSYSIFVSGGSAANYSIAYQTGTLKITPAQLTITPNATSVYGQSPGSTAIVTYDVSGFANGDTLAGLTRLPTISTAATAQSGVGIYFLSASGASDPNYRINYLQGRLQITPATLTLTPDGTTIVQGDAIPTIGINATGLVNGDTLDTVFSTQPTVTTAATTASLPGSYATTVTGGTQVDGNYTLNLVPGTLVIQSQLDSILENVTFVDPGSTNVTQVTTSVTSLPPVTPPTIPVTEPDPPIIVNDLYIAPRLYGTELGAFGGEASTVINMMLAATANATPPADPPYTRDEIIAALKDPSTADTMMGLLLPYVYEDLKNILGQPQSSWTTDQATLVTQVQNYIQAQKQAAAAQAEADYQTWAQSTVADEEKKIASVSGPAQIYEMAILSSDPPVPPDDLMQRVTAGYVQTNEQVIAMNGIGGGTNSLIDTPAAVLEVSRMYQLTKTLAGKGAGSNELASFFNVVSGNKLGKKLFPNAVNPFRAKKLIGSDDSAGDFLANLSKAAPKLLAGAGVILEVAANVVQIGMSAAAYDKAAKFNTAFQAAIDTANKPVSLDDLKSMVNDPGNAPGLINYLAVMASTGGNIPDVTKPSMPLSSILSITQSL